MQYQFYIFKWRLLIENLTKIANLYKLVVNVKDSVLRNFAVPSPDSDSEVLVVAAVFHLLRYDTLTGDELQGA